MIKLTGEIILLPNNMGKLDSATINHSGNNQSADINDVLGKEVQGSRAFAIGGSTLNAKDTFSNGVKYYVGSVPSKEDGTFGIPYIITIKGSNITNLTIVFDTERDEYCESLIVNGNRYYNNSSVFSVSDLPNLSQCEIKLENWNKPKRTAIIQGIYADIKIVLDSSNIHNINIENSRVGSVEKPYFGVYSNKGDVEFVDSYETVLSYIQQSLTDKAKVKFYLEDTLSNKKNEVGLMITDKWNYDNDNKIVKVSLQDDLLEWQEILIEAMPLQEGNYTMVDIYNYLISKTPSKFFIEIEQFALDLLSKVRVKYLYLEASSLWSAWDKLGKACGLNIYKDTNNKVKICKFNKVNNRTINIKSKYIYDVENNKVLDNKITGVDFEENDCGFVTDYKVLVSNNSVTKFNDADAVSQDNEKYFSKETSSAPNYPKPITYHAFARVLVGYTSGTITIPKKKGRNKILKIYDKLDNNGDTYIQYSIRGTLETGDVDETEFYPKNSVDYYGTLEDLTQNTNVYYENELLGTVSTTAQSKTNLGTLTARSDANNFYIDYLVPNTLIKSGRIHKTQKINGIDTWYGNYEFYNAKEIEFSIYGNLYKFNIETNKVTVGTNSNYTLETNELMQKDTIVNTQKYGEVSLATWLANMIIYEYLKGKETAEVLCQIGEYRDAFNNNLAVSTKEIDKPMVIQVGDISIPRVYLPDGTDGFLSPSKSDLFMQGRFTTQGVSLTYDGAVWQKIKLGKNVMIDSDATPI